MRPAAAAATAAAAAAATAAELVSARLSRGTTRTRRGGMQTGPGHQDAVLADDARLPRPS